MNSDPSIEDFDQDCYLSTIRVELGASKLVRDKTNVRLSNLIEKSNPSVLDMSTVGGGTQRVFKLLNTPDVQVFHTIIKEKDTVVGHSHTQAAEFFFVVNGTLGIDDKEFHSGSMIKVAAGKFHAPMAVNADCEVIVITMPPEEAYE